MNSRIIEGALAGILEQYVRGEISVELAQYFLGEIERDLENTDVKLSEHGKDNLETLKNKLPK